MRTIRCDLSGEQADLLRKEVELVARFGLPVALARRITVEEGSGCWRVSGHGAMTTGHKKVKLFGVDRQFHRVVYQLLKGPIPEGAVLDHVRERCSHEDCANPDHLEPVTVAENTFRGSATLFKQKREYA